MFGKLRYGLRYFLDPMSFVGGRFERYGDVYFVGSEDARQPGLFVLRHPAHLEEVLVTKARSFDKGHSSFVTLEQVLGKGLLTANGDAWRRQRRLLQPAFARRRLREYAAAMVREADDEVRAWRSGEILDVPSTMIQMTLRIVCRTLFGYDGARDTETVSEVMRGLQDVLGGPPLPLPSAVNPYVYRMRRARDRLDRVVYRLIDQRAPEQAHEDLLQQLIDAVDDDGGRLAREEIRDQLVTLFLAGHETTSNALTWTFYLLAGHPEEEAKLHAEIDAVLEGRLPTAEDLPSLQVTERVFAEAMRLYPPVYTITRRAVEDVDIGEWRVPAGSELVMWIWHTHRDPRWWDEPWAFRPSRFSADRAADRPRLAYLPFGAGARACIGKVFAQWEGALVLATIAQRARLLGTGGEVGLRPRVTLAPAGGLPMKVELR